MAPGYSLEAVGTLIQDFFNKKTVEATARRTQFVQRGSPLGGQIFLEASVFGFIADPQANLDDLAQLCADLGVDISPQGFDQRINPQAVTFLKAMFSQALDHFKNDTPLRMPDGTGPNRELSAFKVRQILQRFALELVGQLSLLSDLLAVLRKILRRIERFGFKQKRTKQPNICHALVLAFPVYVFDVDLDQTTELPALLA